jgi:hypothetical protein
VKATAIFALLTVVLIAAVGWILSVFYTSPADHRAILVSAGLAIVVQLVAFTIVRLVPREHVVAGWGVGVLLRFAVLALYGLVIANAMGLPSAAALVSLACFLFVSTTIEPLLLKK